MKIKIDTDPVVLKFLVVVFVPIDGSLLESAGKEHCEIQKTTSVGWAAGIYSLDHWQHANMDSTFLFFLLPVFIYIATSLWFTYMKSE